MTKSPENTFFIVDRLRRAVRISPGEWLDFFQAWFWLLFFDVALRLRPFPELQAFASRRAFRPTPAPARVQRLLRLLPLAVDRARVRHLRPMTCLRRSLALQKMFAQKGVPVELRIGVRKEGGQFSAHAWLEYDGNLLGEPEKITEQYAVLQK